MNAHELAGVDMSNSCPYCSSSDTTDCGEVLDGIHHVECNSCRMAFQVEKETGDAF